MKDVVYIVPLTPASHLSPLRKLLRDITVRSLNAQSSSNWEALFVGEEDRREGNITYLPAVALDPHYQKQERGGKGPTDKHFKIDVAMQYIERQERKPKYIARLDDDDFISPSIVSIIEQTTVDYDCFADHYQAMVNVTSGKVCLTVLQWMPNTIFHKYEHAKTFIPEFNCMLINTSHDKGFHTYYKGKNIWQPEKGKPIYLRTLSPTNLSLSTGNTKDTFESHARKYGFWQYKLLPEFEPYLSELYKGYEALSNTKVERNFSSFYRFLSFVSYSYHKRFDNFFSRLLKKSR